MLNTSDQRDQISATERKLRSPAWQMPHPAFGEISFPIAAELYLRQKEIDKLRDKYDREFKTKTTTAVDIVKRLLPEFKDFEKTIGVIDDGGSVADCR